MLEGELQLQALRDEEERTTQKIQQLQTLIADESTSIIQRSKAQVELSRLQAQYCRPKKARESLVYFSDQRIVSKNKQQVERDLQRYAERRRREEELLTKIKKLREEFQNGAATRSAERKRQLEEQLRVVGEEMEALENEQDENDDTENTIIMNPLEISKSYALACESFMTSFNKLRNTTNTSAKDSNNSPAKKRWNKVKDGLSTLLEEKTNKDQDTISEQVNDSIVQMMVEQEAESEIRIKALDKCMEQVLVDANKDVLDGIDKVQMSGISSLVFLIILGGIGVPMVGIIVHVLGIVGLVFMLGNGNDDGDDNSEGER